VLTRPKAQQGFAWDPRAAEAVAGYVRTNFPMGEVASVVMATRLAAAESSSAIPEMHTSSHWLWRLRPIAS